MAIAGIVIAATSDNNRVASTDAFDFATEPTAEEGKPFLKFYFETDFTTDIDWTGGEDTGAVKVYPLFGDGSVRSDEGPEEASCDGSVRFMQNDIYVYIDV
jgi:hypothetical protein